jgi:uncharacterized membrane protein YuzA (DUF378 family)
MNAATLAFVSWILVIVGGINWLLIGLINLNVVSAIFGESILARLIYIIVGLGACYLIYLKVKKDDVTPV